MQPAVCHPLQHQQAAQKWLQAKRVILFGSRAKGNNRPSSDFDFAIEPAEHLIDNWVCFSSEIEENAPTLNKIDIVNLSSNNNANLLFEIEHTGIELWRVK